MAHLPKVNYVHGSVHIKVDLSVYDERVIKAQQWLGDRVLEDCKPLMPLVTGFLQQNSHTESDGKFVVFPRPYARYLYYGKKMVNIATGKGPMRFQQSPGDYVVRYRKGTKLIATDIPLKYSRAEAVAQWFEVAKQKDLQYWVDGVAKIIGGAK